MTPLLIPGDHLAFQSTRSAALIGIRSNEIRRIVHAISQSLNDKPLAMDRCPLRETKPRLPEPAVAIHAPVDDGPFLKIINRLLHSRFIILNRLKIGSASALTAQDKFQHQTP